MATGDFWAMKVGQLVANNIRRIRREQGLSQEELAARAGCNRNYVGMVERCENSPTIEMLERIANALGVEIAALLERPAKRH